MRAGCFLGRTKRMDLHMTLVYLEVNMLLIKRGESKRLNAVSQRKL